MLSLDQGLGEMDDFGLAFQYQTLKNYKKEWTKAIANHRYHLCESDVNQDQQQAIANVGATSVNPTLIRSTTTTTSNHKLKILY